MVRAEVPLALACDGRATPLGLRRVCCSAWLAAGVLLRLAYGGCAATFGSERALLAPRFCFTALVRRWEKELQ